MDKWREELKAKYPDEVCVTCSKLFPYKYGIYACRSWRMSVAISNGTPIQHPAILNDKEREIFPKFGYMRCEFADSILPKTPTLKITLSDADLLTL